MKIVTKDDEIAEALDMHFLSIGPELAEYFVFKQSKNLFKYIKPNDPATFVRK